MSSSEWPDLSRLAALARDQNLDAKPVLLRVHTDLFVAAPSRDRTTIAAFEALALGFLPIVDDATAAAVALKLASVADTPTAVIDALIRRGGETRSVVLAARPNVFRHADAPSLRDHPTSDEDIDLALARDRLARLDSAQLRELVERGRERPQLAMALLGRADLGASDEAALYLHADDARRREIRARLEPIVALAGQRPPARADRDAVEALLGFARALDVSAFEAQLAKMLNLAPAPAWRFQMEPRRELLALALIAAGVASENCIRIFLTIHPAISRSVGTVFQLTQIARSVPRGVAIHLIEAILDVAVETRRDARYMPAADPSPKLLRDRAMRPTVAQIRARILARRAG